MLDLKRREFITLLGGAAAWPVAARAQQRERMRRIGVLSALSADDSLSQGRNAMFLQGLSDLGWRVGHNLQIDFRWGAGDATRFSRLAANARALAYRGKSSASISSIASGPFCPNGSTPWAVSGGRSKSARP